MWCKITFKLKHVKQFAPHEVFCSTDIVCGVCDNYNVWDKARKKLYTTFLPSSSVVFDSMLEQNMKEARLGEVDITDVDPDTLKKMLEFIYTGQVVNRIP